MNFRTCKINEALKVLNERLYPKKVDLKDFLYKECGYKKGNNLPEIDDSWKAFGENDRWGGAEDLHYWFYKKINIEKSDMPVFFSIDLENFNWNVSSPQFIVYLNGEILQGMDGNHSIIPIEETGEVELYIYAYTAMTSCLNEFKASLVYLDRLCEKVYYDIKVPYDAMILYEEDNKYFIDIMAYLDEAVNILDLRVAYSKEYYDSLQKAQNYLEKEFYGKFCKKTEIQTICIGHTHIDVAWLWTLGQTREKVVRSFSTVVALMKEYPEYKFMSSQAQLYKYLKEEAPTVYEDVKELIKQGRWEVEGAAWVEFDCNLPSGESIIRQILFGKKYFKDEFDVDSKVLWLPDVFGYSSALPQILRKSGVDKFITSKLSWSETNQMPYDLFNWYGIDGSHVLTYFLTAQDKVLGRKPKPFTTYNANINPKQIIGTWERFQQKDISNETLLTFGYGDGGGGPTKEMLENYDRLKTGIPGFPTAKIDTATNFLNRLEKRVKNNCDMPKWVGELYLEFHRGTYTSMAKNKKNNRKSEFALANAELFSCINTQINNGSYPQVKINDTWEGVLTNQFHDILPGSSIKPVYEDSDASYARILDNAKGIINNSLTEIANNINTDEGILVFNPNSFVNSDIIEIDDEKVFAENIPPLGYKVIKPNTKQTSVKVKEKSIENKFFKLIFDKDYNIARIYDKQNKREVLSGKGNVLRAFDDRPKQYDAWEITDYYKDKMYPVDELVSAEMINDSARAGLKVTKKFLSSTITQYIYLYDDLAKIDFENDIDWHENHILLKTAFPVDILSDKATYNVQFGNVERPTHRNTSWDWAKFEVCAHKFADLSEDGYGVSLLNDCKYGYDIEGSTMRLTMLKSATNPNPDADKERHTFTYTLYPHRGTFQEGKTVQTAYSLNKPMSAIKVGKQSGKLPNEFSFVKCDCENIIIETVKKAEKDDSVIVRLYDAYKRRANATLSFGFDVKKAILCDMMENEIKEVNIKDNKLTIPVKPFEIITLKLN